MKIKTTVSYHLRSIRICICAQSRLTLRDPMDYSLPGSSVHGIFQARILEWVAMPSSRVSSQPRDQIHVSCISCIGTWILYHCTTWEALIRMPLS